MIKKMRPRYYCEHCKKSGGSAHHMRNHEQSCTLNPDRKCGMCQMSAFAADYLKWSGDSTCDLIAMMPPFEPQGPEGYGNDEKIRAYIAECNAAIGRIRERTECPACMLATLRQWSNNDTFIWRLDFDFKAERDRVLAINNEALDAKYAEMRAMIGRVE